MERPRHNMLAPYEVGRPVQYPLAQPAELPPGYDVFRPEQVTTPTGQPSIEDIEADLVRIYSTHVPDPTFSYATGEIFATGPDGSARIMRPSGFSDTGVVQYEDTGKWPLMVLPKVDAAFRPSSHRGLRSEKHAEHLRHKGEISYLRARKIEVGADMLRPESLGIRKDGNGNLPMFDENGFIVTAGAATNQPLRRFDQLTYPEKMRMYLALNLPAKERKVAQKNLKLWRKSAEVADKCFRELREHADHGHTPAHHPHGPTPTGP